MAWPIGSVESGNLIHNHTEGHSGYIADNIVGVINDNKPRATILKQHPNFILIFVGRNDAVQNLNVSKSVDPLGGMAETLLDRCPDAVILVAAITTNRDVNVAAWVAQYDTA